MFVKNKYMIIINLFLESGCDPITDGPIIHLEGIINDNFDIDYDPGLIQECIQNDDFTPKEEVLYEIQLTRGTIASDPIPESCFVVTNILEKVNDENFGWITPLIRT